MGNEAALLIKHNSHTKLTKEGLVLNEVLIISGCNYSFSFSIIIFGAKVNI